jgi:hypothetical protein
MASHLARWWDLLLLAALRGASVHPGSSLAWNVWLRLRFNTLPMKEFGELIVCSSHSSENYWYMVKPRLQPCVAEDISPCPISVVVPGQGGAASHPREQIALSPLQLSIP